MYSEFAAELWNEFKSLLNPVDKEQAADILVSMLIDNDEHIDDIKKAFKNDELIKHALAFHSDNLDDIDDDYDDDDNQDYDE
jgi:hypothetical protein